MPVVTSGGRGGAGGGETGGESNGCRRPSSWERTWTCRDRKLGPREGIWLSGGGWLVVSSIPAPLVVGLPGGLSRGFAAVFDRGPDLGSDLKAGKQLHALEAADETWFFYSCIPLPWIATCLRLSDWLPAALRAHSLAVTRDSCSPRHCRIIFLGLVVFAFSYLLQEILPTL